MREGSGPRHGGSSCCEVKTARPVAARRPFAPFAAPARYRRGVQKAPETSRCYRRLARCCESRALSFPEPRISCRNAAPAVPRAQLPQTHRHMTDDGRPTVRPWSPERLVYQHEGLSANQMALLAIMKCTPKIKTRKEKIRFTGWPTLALLEYVDDARRSAGGRWRLAMGTKSGCGLKTCRRSTIFTCCCSHRSVRPRQPVVSAPWAAVVVERYVGPFAGLLPRLGGVLARAGIQGGLACKPPTFTLEPGRTADRELGRPLSMCITNDRRLRTKGDYLSLSPEEQAFLANQERCLTGFGWPGPDRDRRPAWRPRPPEGFPALDGLLCSASATAIIRCPALIRLLRHQWTWLGGPTCGPRGHRP
jgi:hypothetical protein